MKLNRLLLTLGFLLLWVPFHTHALGKFSEWSEPVNLGPMVNSEFGEGNAAISRNGLSLYFNSNRPGGSGEPDIWVSQRAGESGTHGQQQGRRWRHSPVFRWHDALFSLESSRNIWIKRPLR